MASPYSMETALVWRTADPEQVAAWQTELLRRHLRQASQARFYRERLACAGVVIEEIRSVGDLARLPLTSRQDLEGRASDFQAVPDAAIADLALSSGTTAGSVQVPYTAADLDRLAFNEAMNFWRTGGRPGNRYLLCVTLDRCFIAGLAYYSGITRLGATAIRSGPGQPARQWELLQQLKPTGLVGVPSFLLKLGQWGEQQDKRAAMQALITIGEPIRTADHSLTTLGRRLAEIWQSPLYSSYGATELQTAFCECEAAQGGHVHPELTLVEIIDEQGRALPPGEAGEVVVTPLGIEGMPLVRFRTGDVARLHTGLCNCGWQTARVGAIEGRLAQRLKYRGTTLYPDTIFQVLQEILPTHATYLEVRSSFDLSEEITVVVGAETRDLTPAAIAELLQARLRVSPEVVVRDKEAVIRAMEEAGGHKLKRFFDFRGKDTH